MNPAESIYRALLRLYPADHRHLYGGQMLQHARDLGRIAERHGRWQVARLCASLLKDGIVNAVTEHVEATMKTNDRFTPAAWLIVLIACIPGLLVTLSRRHADTLAPLLSVLGYLYLGLLAIGLPIAWWKNRRFPLWALLPAGLLIWFLVYFSGTAIAQFINSRQAVDEIWTGIETWISLLELLLAIALFAILLRRRRLNASFWMALSAILAINLLAASYYSIQRYGAPRLYPPMLQYFITSSIGPIEGLMLVAVGLLAARRYGVLALLVVLGGFSYMCLDSDYMFAAPPHDWVGLTPFLVVMSLLYLVIAPIGLLRARTRLGRFLGLFLPVTLFHIARIVVPMLVYPGQTGFPSGDALLSLNVLLSFLLGWVLYSQVEEAPALEPLSQVNAEPEPPLSTAELNR